MDFHILIVISCVFLGSLFFLLLINKFFRRKTFEEVIAEKKALTDKIYGKERTTFKKPKKHTVKKEMKREKKLRQREQQSSTNNDQEDSDGASEQLSVEDDVPHSSSKATLEMEEATAHHSQEEAVAASMSKQSGNVEKESVVGKQSKGKKEKKVSGVNKNNSLIPNKNDNSNTLTMKEEKLIAENLSANNLDVKGPKEFVEFKKSEKKEEKLPLIQVNKKERIGKKAEIREKLYEKSLIGAENIQASIEPVLTTAIAKEIKQIDEKGRQGSPKVTQQKNKPQHNKKQKETKDPNALDMLSDMDTVSVSLLMNLFRRAELNRSEIQILIDYLLNRQQDMPSTHSEWSDDVCQKLKRQLKETEKALAEEQEASIGIQAKLRELRQEINTERVNMNVTVKSYMEKIQAKEQDIAIFEQKIKTLNDNLALERQQFQAKLIHEKQAGSQELLAQMQLIQNEMSHKDKCIAELNCIVNASRQAVEESQQKNDIIQTQAQQLRTLEQHLDEVEQASNSRIFEIEKLKQMETELNEIKAELCNTQTALETSKAENAQYRLDADAKTLAHNSAISEKQQEVETLQAKIVELTQQLMNITSQTKEQIKEQNNLHVAHQLLQQQFNDKQKELLDSNDRENELKQHTISFNKELEKMEKAFKEELADKTQQLQQIVQQMDQLREHEKELLQQLQEQKEKNNELRMKNWKLVEALNNAEIKVIKQTVKHQPNANLVQQEKLLAATAACTSPVEINVKDGAKDEKHTRELFQRVFPEAVKACAETALSTTLEQWIEQVMTVYVNQQWQRQQQQQAQVGSSHKSTQSSSSSSNYHSSSSPSAAQNAHNGDGSRSNSPPEGNVAKVGERDYDALLKDYKLLHTRFDELEQRAAEKDAQWRSIVRSKDEQISALENPNGQQQDI